MNNVFSSPVFLLKMIYIDKSVYLAESVSQAPMDNYLDGRLFQ